MGIGARRVRDRRIGPASCFNWLRRGEESPTSSRTPGADTRYGRVSAPFAMRLGVVYLALPIPGGVLCALAGWCQERLLVTLAALIGWLGQSVVGYLYKIVPFLIWQSRYSALVGKQPVPLMRDLI